MAGDEGAVRRLVVTAAVTTRSTMAKSAQGERLAHCVPSEDSRSLEGTLEGGCTATTYPICIKFRKTAGRSPWQAERIHRHLS